jgi:CheY-like chemotaxis protein
VGDPFSTGAATLQIGPAMGSTEPLRRRALVVEDGENARRRLAEALVALGFEVLEAENGMMALRLLQHQRVDVVLLDMEMPVLDGPSLLRLIRARGDRVPVVLTTSTSAVQRVVPVLRLGASDYVPKPVESGSLQGVLERVLKCSLGPALPAPEAAGGS